MQTITEKIAAKRDDAKALYEGTRARATSLGTCASTMAASDWADYADELARAEGAYAAWNKLAHVVNYFETNNTMVDRDVIMRQALEIAVEHPGDTYSGRGNDNLRAKADGVRDACSQMQYL